MKKIAIIGAASYAGGELLRLLQNHPALGQDLEVGHLTDVLYTGQEIATVFPYLRGICSLKLEQLEAAQEAIIAESDLVFLIMPHGLAAPLAAKIVAAGKKVIDVGADLRFRDALVYEAWYNVAHTEPALTAEAVYGLPELYREQVKAARAVGNPGCYPTASILGLYPLLKAGLVKPNSIIIDAKSGVSGAGRTPSDVNLFGSAAESLKAYGIGSHRHTPEIEQALSQFAGRTETISFTPHLVPMLRGIHATAYAQLEDFVAGAELTKLYEETYAAEYFVTVHGHGQYPQSKWASGSNFCHISVTSDQRTGRAIVCSVIDNLGKGAAGQAIQNMNLMLDFPETDGLRHLPVCP